MSSDAETQSRGPGDLWVGSVIRKGPGDPPSALEVVGTCPSSEEPAEIWVSIGYQRRAPGPEPGDESTTEEDSTEEDSTEEDSTAKECAEPQSGKQHPKELAERIFCLDDRVDLAHREGNIRSFSSALARALVDHFAAESGPGEGAGAVDPEKAILDWGEKPGEARRALQEALEPGVLRGLRQSVAPIEALRNAFSGLPKVLGPLPEQTLIALRTILENSFQNESTLTTLLERAAEGMAYYGRQPSPGRTLWRARFDLDSHPELVGAWQAFLDDGKGESKATPSLAVAAWTSSRQEWERAEASIPADELIRGYAFDHGIVFVHGIGPRKSRETLTEFGEPILACWFRLLKRVTRASMVRNARSNSGTKINGPTYESFVREIFGGRLRTRADHAGLTKTLRVVGNSEGSISEAGLVCGNARVEDTVVDGGGVDLPATTLVRLSAVFSDQSVRETHLLLGEAYWTDKVIPFGFDNLPGWIARSAPFALSSTSYFSVDAIREIFETGWALPKRLPSKLLAVVLGLAPFFAELGFWAGRTLLLLVLQPLLYLLNWLRLLPLGPIQGLIHGLIDTIMRTVGQSHALVESAVRRNAIVRDASRDLEALSSYCEKVTVVAHSQGSEVVRKVANAKRWPRVSRWVTLGPGINALAGVSRYHQKLDKSGLFVTRDDARPFAGSQDRWVGITQWIMAGWPVLVGFLVVAGWLGLQAPLWSPWLLLLLWPGLPLSTFLVHKLRPELNFSRDALNVSDNFYASHDPVSAGPILGSHQREELGQSGFAETKIYNRRSWLHDHTTYFDNLEDFVAPVSIFAASEADFVPEAKGASMESYREEFREYVERRRWLTWLQQVLSSWLAVAAAGVFGQVAWIQGAWDGWSSLAHKAAGSSQGWLGSSWALVTELFLPVASDLRWMLLPLMIYVFSRVWMGMQLTKNQNALLDEQAELFVKTIAKTSEF